MATKKSWLQHLWKYDSHHFIPFCHYHLTGPVGPLCCTITKPGIKTTICPGFLQRRCLQLPRFSFLAVAFKQRSPTCIGYVVPIKIYITPPAVTAAGTCRSRQYAAEVAHVISHSETGKNVLFVSFMGLPGMSNKVNMSEVPGKSDYIHKS